MKVNNLSADCDLATSCFTPATTFVFQLGEINPEWLTCFELPDNNINVKGTCQESWLTPSAYAPWPCIPNIIYINI